MPKILYSFNKTEIQTGLRYALICETMYGSKWNTGSVQRRWEAEFTEDERREAKKIGARAHAWHLKTGVPEEVTMEASTLALWKKLITFCASV